MKQFDLNFIKYEKLFQDDFYRYVYNNAKLYEYLLPEHVSLGNMYLKNFVNFDPSIKANKLIPNAHAELSILIGCKEYLIKDIEDEQHKELYLYFHNVSLNKDLSTYVKNMQFIRKIICVSFDEGFGRYKKPNDFHLTMTNIELFREEFQKFIYDYLEENNIFKLLKAVESLKNIYIDKNFIEVPF